MRNRTFRAWRRVALGALCLSAAPLWAKVSLGVRFPDIVMENVAPGSVINLRQLKGVPYVVINQSDDTTVDVEVESEIPRLGPAQAKEGYEPVPSADWLRVVPNRFKLGPGDPATADVILSVPDDPGLIGRHFQVNIKAKTQNIGMLALAVNSYVRFSVGSAGPQALRKEKNRQSLATLDLDMTPSVIRVEKAPLGKKIDVKSLLGAVLKVTNRGNDAVKLKIVSGGVDQNLRDKGWTSAPDPGWLTLKPAVLKVKPNRIEEAKLYLEIPDAPENRGQHFMFLIQAELADLGIPLTFYTRVYVATEN